MRLGELWDAVYNLEVQCDRRKVRGKPQWATFKRPREPEEEAVGTLGHDDRVRGKTCWEWE